MLGGAGTPCPSDCWIWDSDSKACKVNPCNDCFTLTCGHDAMDLVFKSKLFNIDGTDPAVFATEPKPTYENFGSRKNENESGYFKSRSSSNFSENF